MTIHPTPAERLLAMLDDEQAIETLPAGEIRANLDSVGIDPARCVAFARALATGAGTPGGMLLGAIDIAEGEDDEIAKLETADIDDVRAQIPGGTAAAIAAEARRKSGEDSNVVAMKARRRRILRWGGPAAGIAASVLLFFVAGVQFFDSQKQETDFYDAVSSGGDPVKSGEMKDEVAAGDRQPAEIRIFELERDTGGVPEELAKQVLRSEEEAPVVAAAPPASEPSADVMANVEETTALRDRGYAETPQQQGAGASTSGGSAGTEGLLSQPLPAEEAFGYTADESADDKRARKAAAPVIDAMVILDPSQVPLAVQSQALPDAGLRERLDEARLLAGGRPVIALYRVGTGATQQDFAQIPLQPGKSQHRAAPSPLAELLGAEAVNYDFVALPESR